MNVVLAIDRWKARLTPKKGTVALPEVLNGPFGIGHSHLASVQTAADAQGFPFRAVHFWLTREVFVGEDADRRFTPEIERSFGDDVISFVGGSAHDMVGLAAHPRPFDFILPAAPELPLIDGAEIVPAGAVRAAVLAIAQEYLYIIMLLRRSHTGRLIHVGPPPPFSDGDRMAGQVPWGLFPGSPHVVSPKFLRLKLWRLHCEILEDFCREQGIDYLASPPDGADEEGFLRSEFYHDPGHANAAYGALVLDQLRSALG